MTDPVFESDKIDGKVQWARERRLLVLSTALLVVLLVVTSLAVAVRFERDGTRLYAENLHALVGAAAAELGDDFRQVEKFVSVLAQSDVVVDADRTAVANLLLNTVEALRDRGAVAAVLLRGHEAQVVPQQALGVRAAEIIDRARVHCPSEPGKFCIAHVGGDGGEHLIIVSGRHAGSPPREDVVVAIAVDWKFIGNRVAGQTKLDRWSKTFILDRDGTLLAWPSSDKLPGFSVVDENAGCADCHQSAADERLVGAYGSGAVTLDIANEAHLVVTDLVPVGDGYMKVGMVAPRSAAVARLGSVLIWGVLVVLVIAALIASLVFRLYRLSTSQVKLVSNVNAEVQRLNTELEHKVRERTRELEEAHARAQQTQIEHATLDRLAAIGELAAAFAHEVRTPLNALSIAQQRLSRMARRGDPIDPAIALDIAGSQARDVDVINSYVENYLQSTRKARSGTGGEVGPCPLLALVDEVFGYVSPEARRSRVLLRSDVIPAALTVRIDRGKLRHVLMNLVLNAVQVQPQGGEVVVGARLSEPRLEIEVLDSGPGVPPEHVGDIFEPFHSYREGGTGLGLAISQRLAKEESATISCRPRVGGGAAFVVSWPVLSPVESNQGDRGEARRDGARSS